MRGLSTYFKFNSLKWALTLTLFFGLFACLGNSVSYKQIVKSAQTELVYSSKSELKNKTSFKTNTSKFSENKSIFNSIEFLYLSVDYSKRIKVKLHFNTMLILSFDTPDNFFQTRTISQTSDEDHFLLV